MSGLMRCLVQHAYVCMYVVCMHVCVLYTFCTIAQRHLSVSMSDAFKFSAYNLLRQLLEGENWMCVFVLNKIKRMCVCVCVFGIRMRPSVSMILTLFLNAYVNTHKNTHVASSLAVRQLVEVFCKTFSPWKRKLYIFDIILWFKLIVWIRQLIREFLKCFLSLCYLIFFLSSYKVNKIK